MVTDNIIVLFKPTMFCFFVFPCQTAVKTRCNGMHFLVTKDNKKSIEFYKRRGALDLSAEEGWRLFEIGKDDLLKMTAK